MRRGTIRLILAVFRTAALLLAFAGSVRAEVLEMTPVRLGVLAFRPADQTITQWAPTASYLESELRGRPVAIVPVTLETIEAAVKNREIDFLLANPEQYVVLAYQYQLAAVATLLPSVGGRPISRFGGVIFARSERADIATLKDIAGKKVAAVSDKSFAGFLMQRWTLQQAGVDVRGDGIQLVETGLPQDKVVQEVLAGRADVGFARTGVLEAMEREGKFAAGELRVINPRAEANFPLRLSTDLYPEWPLAALSATPESLSKAVTLALFRMPTDHHAARTGQYFGFSPPGDYTSVEALLHRLHMHPDRLQHFGMPEIARKYAYWLGLFATFCVLIAAAVALMFRRQNQQLLLALREAERLALRDELLSSLSEGVYGVDPFGRCTFVNQAALDLLGFKREELVGSDQHALIHHHWPDGREYAVGDCPVRQTLIDGKARHTEEVFFRADGTPLQVRMGVHPVWLEGRVAGVVVAFQDISKQKADEAHIREMALHDALTGLPNRRLLNDRCDQVFARGERSGAFAAVLFLDLDGFKPVNDRYGHDAGDLVLVEVARRLESCVRAADTVARLAGDEFVVVLAELALPGDAERICDKLLAAVAEPIVDGSRRYSVTVSVGVAWWPGHGSDIEALLRVADRGMYTAKDFGKNCWRWGAPLPAASVSSVGEGQGAIEQ